MAAKKMTVAEAAAKAKADIAKKKADERAKALQAQAKLDSKPANPSYGSTGVEKALDKATGIAGDALNWIAKTGFGAAKKKIEQDIVNPVRTAGKVVGKIPGVKSAADAFAQGGKQVADTVNELVAGRPSEAGKAFVGKKNVTNPNIVGQIAHGLTLGDETKRFVRGKTTAMDVANVALMFGGGAVEEALLGRGFSPAEVKAFKESDAVKKAIKTFESNAPKEITTSGKTSIKTVENPVNFLTREQRATQKFNDAVFNATDFPDPNVQLNPSAVSKFQEAADIAGVKKQIIPAQNKAKFLESVAKNKTATPDNIKIPNAGDTIIVPKHEVNTAANIRGEGYNGKPSVDAERFSADVPTSRRPVEHTPLEYNGEIPYKDFKKLEEANKGLTDAKNLYRQLKDELDNIKGNTPRRQELLGNGEDGLIPTLDRFIKSTDGKIKAAQSPKAAPTRQEVIDAWDSLLKHQGYRRELARTGRTQTEVVNPRTYQVEQNPHEPLPTDTMEADTTASQIAGDKGGLGLTTQQMENVAKRADSVDRGIKNGTLNMRLRQQQLGELKSQGYVLGPKELDELKAIREGTWRPQMARRTKAEMNAFEASKTAKEARKALSGLQNESMMTRGRILLDKVNSGGKLTMAEKRELKAINDRTWQPSTDWTKPTNPKKPKTSSTVAETVQNNRKFTQEELNRMFPHNENDSVQQQFLNAMMRGENVLGGASPNIPVRGRKPVK